MFRFSKINLVFFILYYWKYVYLKIFCLELMFNTFFPSSKAKPKIKIKKKISNTTKPYNVFSYALTAYGYTNIISKSNSKNNNAKIKKEILNCILFCSINEL